MARWTSQSTEIVRLSGRIGHWRQAIIDSELGFIEIPALNRKAPSTKFRIRGQQLSVDILTPMLGRTSQLLRVLVRDSLS